MLSNDTTNTKTNVTHTRARALARTHARARLLFERGPEVPTGKYVSLVNDFVETSADRMMASFYTIAR
jgi:hypothetical protein